MPKIIKYLLYTILFSAVIGWILFGLFGCARCTSSGTCDKYTQEFLNNNNNSILMYSANWAESSCRGLVDPNSNCIIKWGE